MENSARLYHCARCHRQVVICRRCDRGNIYCPDGCAEKARRDSLRNAGRRYQQTHQGRLRHAERQRRYRARQQKVTHQGSPCRPLRAPLPDTPEQPLSVQVEGPAPEGAVCCHFCRQRCSPFLRQTFLQRRSGTVLSKPRLPAAQAQAP